MVGAWGWRKKISPEEEFSTTGEVLLICEKATAKQSKCYNTNDRSELGFSENKALRARANPLG